jgi:hypothetical protein
MGTVAEVAFVATESTARKPWIRFTCLIAASFILIGIAIALLPFKIPGITFSRWTLPTPSTIFYGMSFVIIGVWMMIGRQRILLSLSVMSVGLLVFNLGYFMDVKVQRSERTLEEMARIKSHLPPDVSLVSLGITNHKFTYYYGKFITPLPVDSDGKCVTYFCFDPCLIDVTKITFPWKQIDTFSLTRDLLDQKRHVVLAKKNDG